MGNMQGKPRIARYYDGADQNTEKQKNILRKIHAVVSSRSNETCCNFFHDEELLGEECTIVYKHFATLYFVIVVDQAENELAALDLIEVFVQALDTTFESVCEIDLIFNYDKVNYVLDEIV